jgi:predicted DNA-binding protein
MAKVEAPSRRRYVVAGKRRKQRYGVSSKAILLAMPEAMIARLDEVSSRVGMSRSYFAYWLIEYGLSKLTAATEEALAARVQAGEL